MSLLGGLIYLIKVTLAITIVQWLIVALSLATLWLVILVIVGLFTRLWRGLTWRR